MPTGRGGRAKLWVLVLAVLAAVAGWAAVNRHRLARQWACYQVASAETFDQARRRLAWFEQEPGRAAKLDELVAKWGTGNPRFDRYLGEYLFQPECSEALRARFAARVGRRGRLLKRWAHYWSYRAPLPPRRQVASILRYHDTLYAEPGKRITWREVPDLQAAFALLGQPERAGGLTPETWRDHYRVFQERRAPELPDLARPDQPLPDG
jgi:hypothetical protein